MSATDIAIVGLAIENSTALIKTVIVGGIAMLPPRWCWPIASRVIRAVWRRGTLLGSVDVRPADALVQLVDSSDRPRFESQAAYLDRLGLLLNGERERLSPADFRHEVITVDDTKGIGTP